MKRARKKRKHDKEIQAMLKEGFLFLLLLFLIYVIIFGSKNPLVFHSNHSIVEEVGGSDMESFKSTVRMLL